jgi:glyoxylate/hydroxypyruvate reductase
MSILLAVTGWNPQPWLARLPALLPGHIIATPETMRDPACIRYAVTWRHAHGALANLPNLQAIFSLGAGVDHLFGDPLLPQAPIVRVVDPDLRDRMSEWVLLHTLLHHRQQRRYDLQQARRIWDDDENQPAARDVRVGILGLGVLGQDCARKLSVVGFDVAGWSRTPRAIAGIASYHGAEGLDALLVRTDILVCLLPLTRATRGILNAGLFVRLARNGRLGGPVLINAGRGGLQVEADIIAALNSGVLKGASLDVFEAEPLSSASPLWARPNVLVSPHNAAISELETVARYVARQITAFEKGAPLENVVDRGREY